jgi:hypothetical protein
MEKITHCKKDLLLVYSFTTVKFLAQPGMLIRLLCFMFDITDMEEVIPLPESGNSPHNSFEDRSDTKWGGWEGKLFLRDGDLFKVNCQNQTRKEHVHLNRITAKEQLYIVFNHSLLYKRLYLNVSIEGLWLSPLYSGESTHQVTRSWARRSFYYQNES